MATDNDTTTAVALETALEHPFGVPMPCDPLLLILERYEALTSMAWDSLEQGSPVVYLLETFNRDFRAALGSLSDQGLMRDLDEITLTNVS